MTPRGKVARHSRPDGRVVAGDADARAKNKTGPTAAPAIADRSDDASDCPDMQGAEISRQFGGFHHPHRSTRSSNQHAESNSE